MEVKLFGKVLGEAESWDAPADDCLYFYGFKPNDFGKKFLNCTLDGPIDFQLDYVKGEFEYLLDSDTVLDDDREITQKLNVNWSALA